MKKYIRLSFILLCLSPYCYKNNNKVGLYHNNKISFLKGLSVPKIGIYATAISLSVAIVYKVYSTCSKKKEISICNKPKESIEITEEQKKDILKKEFYEEIYMEVLTDSRTMGVTITKEQAKEWFNENIENKKRIMECITIECEDVGSASIEGDGKECQKIGKDIAKRFNINT